jgi:4,5-dihydroxyphthalate decarboxylase
MPNLPLTISIFNHGQWDALRNGDVSVDGVRLERMDRGSPYRPMVRELAFDVAEVAFTTYICAKSFDIPITAIPIFSNRDLTMTPVVYNTRSGITKPKDLEGKRVGLRSYTVTNNTQCRGLLAYEYGVDADLVTWVVTEDAHVSQYKDPVNVEYAPIGSSLEDMLIAGEIDAGIQLRSEIGGDIQELISEEERDEIGTKFFRDTGVYPIGHVMAIRDEVLALHPEVGIAMFHAFVESKNIYMAGLDSKVGLSQRDNQAVRNRDAYGGDPFPMGIAANSDSIEGMVRMYVEQRIISAPIAIDHLFAPNTLDS